MNSSSILDHTALLYLQTGLSRDGGDTVDVSKRLSTSGG